MAETQLIEISDIPASLRFLVAEHDHLNRGEQNLILRAAAALERAEAAAVLRLYVLQQVVGDPPLVTYDILSLPPEVRKAHDKLVTFPEPRT